MELRSPNCSGQSVSWHFGIALFLYCSPFVFHFVFNCVTSVFFFGCLFWDPMCSKACAGHPFFMFFTFHNTLLFLCFLDTLFRSRTVKNNFSDPSFFVVFWLSWCWWFAKYAIIACKTEGFVEVPFSTFFHVFLIYSCFSTSLFPPLSGTSFFWFAWFVLVSRTS